MTQCSHKPRKNEAVEEVSKGERLMSERTSCVHQGHSGSEPWKQAGL